MSYEDGPPPWQRQRGETAAAFHAFTHYRDLPPGRRSVRAAEEEHRRQCLGNDAPFRWRSGRWTGWSWKWRWRERAEAWDAERDRIKREQELRTLELMTRRHAALSLELQLRALERLRTLSPTEIDAATLLRYLIESVRLERLVRGEPETRIETTASMRRVLEAFQRLDPVERPDALVKLAEALFGGSEGVAPSE